MLVPTLALLSLLTATSAKLHKSVHHRRAQYNNDPVAPGDPTNGWQQLPETTGASLVQVNVDSYQIPVYQSADKDNSAITRGVIVLPARHRDCWNYWNIVNNALFLAEESNEDVTAGAVSIMSPCFLTEEDKTAGAAGDQTLLYGATTWVSGHESKAPEGADVSSYDIMDQLIGYYLDKNTYPNLKNIVIAGHSAGAQLVQRYAALRKSTDNDDMIHYYIANPGSLLWLTADRPYTNDTCVDFDYFKYGLTDKFPGYATGDAKRLGRDGLVERYRNRNIHYAWGMADDGAGDTRCEAFTQGHTHLQRGQQYVTMLTKMTGGFPKKATADWIQDVSHDAAGMMMSPMGLDKLFRFPYN